MGLLSKQNRESNGNGSQTVIAEGTFIEGQLKLTCHIQIDGQVKGNIETDQCVTISAAGSVEGSIRCDCLIVNGRFVGKVYSKSLQILESGHLEGEVSATEFTIEKGGVFLGSSRNINAEEVVPLTSVKKRDKTLPEQSQKGAEQYA